MVLIFSIKGDPSTNDVIDWLLYFGESYFRINNVIDLELLIKQYPISTIHKKENRFTSVWYRKAPDMFLPIDILGNTKTDKDIRNFSYSEQNGLLEAVYSSLEESKWLNHWSNSSPSKIKQLLLAERIGLKVPNTIIVSTKEQLYDFFEQNEKIIIKPIQDMSPIEIDGDYYFQYTKSLKKKDIQNLKDIFFPCLLQKEVDKNMEVRSFYINGRFYSMAICSIFDTQTKMDFRRYNDSRPNRVVPYSLPAEIEQKLFEFMTKMNLNCGSVDLILDTLGDYYFLEVNPVGQFGMVSYPCNYYLEREIASFLTKDNR